ncbi:hypothetical protein OPT61_g6041 [Boeremia exigua]|uniref:Uncharacterized protein n=1 Tax=Boeremia exigua TaxID=749465 RepID=A0ACC2I830_9PLEO|nr:hypothetical protein OPT61_g6041 [Boeremia exigua]
MQFELLHAQGDSPHDSTPSVLGPDTDRSSESEDSNFDAHRKPPLPYKIGFEFTARAHEAPPALDVDDIPMPPSQAEKWNSMSQTEYCLTDPVPDLSTYAGVSKVLKITSIIRVGSDRGAQLVVVNSSMVAKIYDPLYYDEMDWMIKQDVLRAAKGDYSREAAAYQQLQHSPAAKGVTPAYYGTWAATIATPIGPFDQQEIVSRAVYMILIEHLQGECMQYVNPYEMRRRVRSRILKKVLDAEAIISDAGVRHRDCHPRNVILLGSSYDSPDLEVKVIDFNIARVLKPEDISTRVIRLKAKSPDKLCSPILRHYGSMEEFSASGWCPDDRKEAGKWLWRHFNNDQRYFPVVWDPEHSLERPRYLEDCGSELAVD